MAEGMAAGYASEVAELRRELETVLGLLRRLALAHYHEASGMTNAERNRLRDEISALFRRLGHQP